MTPAELREYAERRTRERRESRVHTPEGISYVVEARDWVYARVFARAEAKRLRHTGYDSARVLHVEELEPGVFEVVLEVMR